MVLVVNDCKEVLADATVVDVGRSVATVVEVLCLVVVSKRTVEDDDEEVTVAAKIVDTGADDELCGTIQSNVKPF